MNTWLDSATWEARNARYLDELSSAGLLGQFDQAVQAVRRLEQAGQTDSAEYSKAADCLKIVRASIHAMERRHNYLPTLEYPWLPNLQPLTSRRDNNGDRGRSDGNSETPTPPAPPSTPIGHQAPLPPESVRMQKILRAFASLRVVPESVLKPSIPEADLMTGGLTSNASSAAAHANRTSEELSWTALVDASKKKPAKALHRRSSGSLRASGSYGKRETAVKKANAL